MLSRTYHFDFDHPLERLWALVSDTPRWGEASGFPKYQASEELQDDGQVRIRGQLEIAGMTIAWEEPPANWIAERWFEQRRVFSRGPLTAMATRARLEPDGDRSRLQLELEFEPRNLVGSLLARRMLGAFEGKIRALLAAADRLIRAEQPDLFETAYRPPPAALERAEHICGKIVASPYGHGLAGRLLDYINRAQAVDLWTMRPLAIARRWGTGARDTVELFLQSVRSGLLESRWDVLCPRCRVSKSSSANLSELPHGVHCDACNIDFESDFASNVELSFSPSPSIRPVEYGFFCRTGPGVTPHIKGQCSLRPGERRSLPLVLPPGDYRIRTLEAGESVDLSWAGGPFPRIRVRGDEVALDTDADSGIEMHNAGQVTRTVVIEEQGWLRDALTAERATTLQAFRDLFSDQVLRPGDEVSIRNIVFVFTDLVGSSGLFTRLGDAEAYRLVREHFAEVADIVRRHQGNIVKTVGDGVHAAFLTPDDGLRAAIEMQLAMPGFNRRLSALDLSIRIGLHAGSSIAVTLNDRLDYYGEAVNLAARLEAQGEAGEIVMSKAFTADPAVDAMLADYEIREQALPLKGFAEPVAICKIRPQARHEQKH